MDYLGSPGLKRSLSRFGTALPLDESFIQRLEFSNFTPFKQQSDYMPSKRVDYLTMAARVKKFGYNGISVLNSKHLPLVFNDLPIS